MFSRFIPFAHSVNIYDVDVAFYKRNNIKTLFIDLDNTLDSYRLYHPKDAAREYIKLLIDNDIKPVIISNNKGKRVSTYANDLGIDYIANSGKPFAFKIKKEIKKRGLNNDEVMLVGDQMITDVLAAKGANIKVLLCEKLVEEDQWTTRFNRLFDKPIRKYHREKGNLINWRDR